MEQARRLKELASDMSLIYVEDEKDIREETGEFLKKFFLAVDVARNGKEGLELFEKHRHDLIVTDVVMPVMEGLEMIEHIRAIDIDVPILVLSAYDYSSLLEPQMKNGANGCLKKPVSYDALVDALYHIVEKEKNKEDTVTSLKSRIVALEFRVAALESKITSK